MAAIIVCCLLIRIFTTSIRKLIRNCTWVPLQFYEFSFNCSNFCNLIHNFTNKISIVMIDSITNSVCLCYYVQNGLSYSGEETRPTLCIKRCQAKIWRDRS